MVDDTYDLKEEALSYIATHFKNTGLTAKTSVKDKRTLVKKNEGKTALIRHSRLPKNKYIFGIINPESEHHYSVQVYSCPGFSGELKFKYSSLEELIVENY